MQKCLSLIKLRQSQFCKFLFRDCSYVTIKPHYTVKDIVYKEQVFEFLAVKGKTLSNDQIIELIRRLNTFKILESELKDFKNFFRDLFELELPEENKEEVVNEILKFFLEKMKAIESMLCDKEFQIEIENTDIDRDFSSVEYSAIHFVLRHSRIFTRNDRLVNVFEFLNKFRFSDDKVFNERISQLLGYYQRNNFREVEDPLNVKSKLLSILLELSIETGYSDTDKIKYVLNDFIIHLTDWNSKGLDNSKEITDTFGKILYYTAETFTRSIADDMTQKELKHIQEALEKLFLANQMDPQRIIKTIRESKEEKKRESYEERISYQEEKDRVFNILRNNV